MLTDQPTLHTLHKGASVRHLLIEGDDPAAKTLSKLENAVRTVVATGTHYEMDQKAMALIQEWCEKDDFRWRGDDARVWESLQDVVALAKLMGHTSLRDPQYITSPALPLDRWQGCKDKYGDDYQYAYTGMTIEACPRVTTKHGVNLTPATNQEALVELSKIAQIREALGPDRTFLLD